MRRLLVAACALFLAAACSEPPQKEIDRAQGAIDAARAAGAEQYAAEPLRAATTALAEAHDAVEQRDYRLALARATDANERAQDAARQAADGKAAALTRTEMASRAATNALTQLQTRLKQAESARLAPRDLAREQKTAAAAERRLQEARTQMQQGRYAEADEALNSVRTEIEAQIRALDELIKARAARPSRTPRRR